MKVIKISIDKILEPSEQIRKVIVYENLEELAKSIKKIGIIEPLVVKQQGEKYEVIAGHRRLLAARMAGLAEVPCIIKDDINIDEDEVKLHENFYREDVNEADEAEFYAYLIEKKGMSIAEIAQKVGKSDTYVRQRLDLLRGDPAILEAVRAGHINSSVARELNAIDDENVRRYYLKHAVDGGVTLRVVREWRRNYEREKETKKALEAGVKKEELPRVLPKYYYQCPVCSQPIEIDKVFALQVCEQCYNYLVEQLKKAEQEAAK